MRLVPLLHHDKEEIGELVEENERANKAGHLCAATLNAYKDSTASG